MSMLVMDRPALSTNLHPMASWCIEREDRVFVKRTRTRFRADRFAVEVASLDPRDWMRAQTHGSLSDGCGYALARCLELVHWLKTGSTVHLSGRFGDIAVQMLSGMRGRDSGATICGAMKTAKVIGVCRERIMPTTRFCDTFSVRARRNARRFRALSHSMLQSYVDVLRFLSAGLGAILLAIPWREAIANAQAIVDRDTGRSLGFHVVAVVGIGTDVNDERGRPYLIVCNSHGPRWGKNGFALVAPNLFDDWGERPDALMVGFSDLDRYEKRSLPVG